MKVYNEKLKKETVEFVKLSWMEIIQANPEKKILLLLDELNRASADIEGAIFNLLESKIDGVYYHNLQVVACINHGDAYSTNMEFDDIAFRRRAAFIKYTPEKKDALTFIKKNEYHPDLVLACEDKSINMLNYTFQNEEGYIYEQPTTYGSFHSFNRRLINCARIDGYAVNIGNFYDDSNKNVIDKKIVKAKQKATKDKIKTTKESMKGKGATAKDIKLEVNKITAREEKFIEITENNFHWILPTKILLMELKTSVAQFFNEIVGRLLITKITDINSLRNIDIVEEVIKKGVIPEDYMNHKEDILLRCKSEIVKDPMLLEKYSKKIITLFEGRFEYVPVLFDQIVTKAAMGEYKDVTYEQIDKILERVTVKELNEKQLDELMSILNQDNSSDEF